MAARCPARQVRDCLSLARLAALVIPVLICACAGQKPQPSLGGKPVIGLTLNEELIIPGGSATLKFQRAVKVSAADRFTPFCEFEVNRVSEQPQSVAPGRFRVTGVGYRVVGDSVTRIPIIMGRDRSCDDPIYPEVRFRLRAEAQPNVRSLTCLNVCIHCRSGCYYPGPAQIQAIVGPGVIWEVADQ